MGFYSYTVKLIGLMREYFGIKYVYARSYLKKQKLDRLYNSHQLNLQTPPIPKPSLNDNQTPTNDIAEYISDYFSLQNSVYPYIERTAHLGSSSVTLDFGCGFGTLAASFKLSQTDNGKYYGYDTNQRAMNFCQSAYQDDPHFSFFGPEIDKTTNYVTNKRLTTADQAFKNRQKASPSRPDIERLLGDQKLTCQFSLSVFTHMWPEDAIESLKVFGDFSTDATIFINSWLILDEFAMNSVSVGTADRKLPIEVGGVYTYSQLNPLVCTAYPSDLLSKVYLDAGHEIIKINFGTWSGRSNGITYQDIVVSKLV